MSRTITFLAFLGMMNAGWHARADEPEPGKQVAQKLAVKDGDGMTELHYLLFLPREAGAAGKPVPLMLFLHGAGERGENLELVKVHGPPKLVESDPAFPFLVVSPQCPKGQRWNTEQLNQLIDHVAKRFHADSERLYVTGLSMGGYGTWALLAAYPDRFAAAIPICGGGDPKVAEKLTATPIWAFHGAKDTAVPLSKSEEMLKAIQDAGGKLAKLTVYPDAGHDSWTATYKNQEVYDWLLSHRRKP